MKKIITWIMLVAMILGMFAGCGQAADPTQAPTTAPVEIPEISATTENNALDVINYLNAIYKDSGAKTSGDFQRFGIVRIAGVPYTVEWTVDVAADKVTVDVHDDGTVTINVNEKCTEDTKYVLTATVTDGNGNTETATWEYLLPGVASVEEMQAIVDQAYSLEVGEALTETVTLYGVITSIDTPYSEQYQNITVTIQIEGREDKPIMCYRLKGEGAADLNPGDTISVQGIIKNYNNKIEFDAGCTINFVEKTGTPVVIPTDPHQILNDVYALGDNDSLPYGPVTLTGRICSIDDPYSDQYKNITVTICVDWYTIKCYRLKGEGAESLEMNDIITVKGYIKKYNGTREFDVPELLDVVKVGETPKPSDPIDIVKTAYALDPGWSVPYGEVTLTGVISKVNSAYNDEFKNITVTMYIDNDVNKQYPIECYRMVSSGGENDEKIKDLKVNDLIVAKGVLMKYQSTRDGSTKVELNCPELVMVATYEEMVVRDAHEKLNPGESFSGKHYITGSIRTIDKAYTAADGLTATLVLDYMMGWPVQCVNIKGLDADKLKIGDKITVMGTVSKAADGTVKMGPDCDFIPIVLPATVNAADNNTVMTYASKLLPGQRMVDDTILTGLVTSIDSAYRAQYDNVTLTIKVGDKYIQCYRLKGDDAATVQVGDTIIVGGFIMNYNGNLQFIEGCKFVTLKKAVPGFGIDGCYDKISTAAEFTSAKYVMVVSPTGYAPVKLDGKWVTTAKPVVSEDGSQVTDSKFAVWTLSVYGDQVKITDSTGATIAPMGGNTNGITSGDYKWKWTRNSDGTFTFSGVGDDTVKLASNNNEDPTYGGFHKFRAYKNTTISSNNYPVNFTLYKMPGSEFEPAPDQGGSGGDSTGGATLLTSKPADGDVIAIVNGTKAMTTTVNSYNKINGEKATITDGKLTVTDTVAQLKVSIDADGYYTFTTPDGKYLTSGATGNSLTLAASASDYSLWTVESAGSNQWYIKSVNAKYSGKVQSIEYYKDNFTTYGHGTTAAFRMDLYLISSKPSGAPLMTAAPTNGSTIAIVNGTKAMTTTASGSRLAGETANITDGYLTVSDKTAQLKVSIDANGHYTFTTPDGKFLTSGATGNSLTLAASASQYSLWTVESAGNNKWYIKNVNAKYSGKVQSLEYYNNFTTYGHGTTAAFKMDLYLISEGSGSVTPPPVTPETPTVPDIYMTSAPKNGDKVVIVAPAFNKALSTAYEGFYNKGVDVAVSGNKLTGYADSDVWTVVVNSDGSYSFETNGQKFSMDTSYTSTPLGKANDKWTVTSVGDRVFNIVNIGRADYALQWRDEMSSWSAYNYGAPTTDNKFHLAFYLVESGSGSGAGGETPDTPPATDGALTLTVDSLKLATDTYYTGKATVDGIGLDLTQIGNYGNGIQMRDKDGKTSILFNTDALPGKITKIELTFSANKSTYNNADAVIFSFGAAKDNLTYSTKLSTVAGTKNYTITPEGDFSFFKIEHDLGYTMYWDSIKIFYEAGSGSVTPDPTPDPDPNPDTPVTGESQYVKVESAADFTTGKYVMVVSNGSAPSTYSSGWVLTGKPTVGDGVITADNAAGYIWDITVNGSSAVLTDGNGATIKPKAGNTNGVQTGSYNWAWAFSGGTFTFKGTGSDTTTFACNTDGTNGLNKFRAYKNTTVSGKPTVYLANFTLYKLTEVAAEPELTVIDIAEALKAATGTELKITGYVNMVDGNKVYVQDATGAVCVEMASSGANKGETFTFTGTKAAGSVITGTAAEKAASALTQIVTELPLYDVSTDVHLYHYISITSELTIVGKEGDYITVADEEDNQFKIQNAVCAEADKLVEGAVITFKGILTGEDAGYMVFKNTDASEITIVKEAPSEEPETPPAAPTVKYADFDTISSTGDSSYTKTYTTASGWTVKNSAIQVGGPSVANPAFPVVGADKSSKAPCLNGKVSAPGSLTSPTLTGGISKLNINYTKMFTDTTLGATITITDLSTGVTYTDVLSKTADKNTKYEIWYYEWTLPTTITGDFTITIVNNSPTGNSGNKDRLTILDLFWTTA